MLNTEQILEQNGLNWNVVKMPLFWLEDQYKERGHIWMEKKETFYAYAEDFLLSE